MLGALLLNGGWGAGQIPRGVVPAQTRVELHTRRKHARSFLPRSPGCSRDCPLGGTNNVRNLIACAAVIAWLSLVAATMKSFIWLHGSWYRPLFGLLPRDWARTPDRVGHGLRREV